MYVPNSISLLKLMATNETSRVYGIYDMKLIQHDVETCNQEHQLHSPKRIC